MAVDVCEPEVIQALEKQGWRVKEKPLMLALGTRSVYADLLLSRVNEDDERALVVVEVKCFNDPERDLPQLYDGIGQYVVYRHILRQGEATTPIYLSIPAEAYERLVHIYELQRVFERSGINLVIIDIDTVEVMEWITWTPS